MTLDVTDSSHLLADNALHVSDSARSVRDYAAKLFAEIAVRIVAFGADLILVLFAVTFGVEHIFGYFGTGATWRTTVWIALLFVWFTASWASPMRATPFQFLLGMRVVDESGARLSLYRAAIRSIALLALWGLTIWLFGQLFVSEPLAKALAVALLLYVTCVTTRRQGLHDLVARSIVINKRPLRNDADEQRMRAFLADTDPFVRKHSRPSAYRLFRDAVALTIPLYLMVMVIEVSNQRNMYARVAYAFSEMYVMRDAVNVWFAENGRLPANDADVGLPRQHDFPDGGFYRLEDRGVIRIQFEVRPELRNGSILWVPEVDGEKLVWQCRTEGDIANRYVPGMCRDQ